jgi:hypothetical protein
MSDSKSAFEKIERHFTSGNSVDVERATILKSDWELAKQYMIPNAQDGGEVEPFGAESAYQTAKKSILTGSNMIISCDLVRELVEALRNSESQQPSAVVPDGCKWHSDDNGCWMSECGKEWWFNEGGPEDNGMLFCVKCGNPCIEQDQDTLN